MRFSPTIVFLDREGRVSQRLNGYYPPHRFSARSTTSSGPDPAQPLAAGSSTRGARAGFGRSQRQAVLREAPIASTAGRQADRGAVGTALLRATDEMHRKASCAPQMKALLARFEVVRLTLGERRWSRPPETMPAEEWARRQGIAYYAERGVLRRRARVFRIRNLPAAPSTLATSFAYVARAYRKEPEFQRFLQGRADELQAAAKTSNYEVGDRRALEQHHHPSISVSSSCSLAAIQRTVAKFQETDMGEVVPERQARNSRPGTSSSGIEVITPASPGASRAGLAAASFPAGRLKSSHHLRSR